VFPVRPGFPSNSNSLTAKGENPTSEPHSDALVFFGATGDLAYKKIFPALQGMVRRGHLNVPVIGVAKAGWTLDRLKARARDSVEKHGGLDPAAFAKLSSLLRYVDGDYQHPAAFASLRQELGGPIRNKASSNIGETHDITSSHRRSDRLDREQPG
jgi:hypothetical protein